MTLILSKRIALAAAIIAIVSSIPSAAQEFVLAGDDYEVVHDVAFESGVLSVLDNDPTLPEGRLIVSVTRGPDHGALVMRPDGTFMYTPDPGYLGEDSFDYVVELRPIQVLTFGPEAMSLNVRARVDLGTFGSDSDSQDVTIGGTVGLDIGISGDPVTEAQVVELDASNLDPIDLDLDYGVFGTIRLDAENEQLGLFITQAGPGAPTQPPLGYFQQPGSKLGVDVAAHVEGTGLISTELQAQDIDLITETDIVFTGFVLRNGASLTLILDVDSQNQFEVSGRDVEIEIVGQISAEGPYLPGGSSDEATVALNVISPVAISETELPGPFQLKGIFPNPISTRATIEVELDRAARLSVDIFDMLGRKVESLPVGYLGSGRHSLDWEASDLTRGIYIVRVQAGDQSEARTVVVQ